MKYHGASPITLYHGNYGPRSRYRNNVKVAGWKPSEKTGATLEWTDTYHDKFLSAVMGGASSQVVTVQGKNLFDKERYNSLYRVTINQITNGFTVTSTMAGTAFAIYRFNLPVNTAYTIKWTSSRSESSGGGINVYGTSEANRLFYAADTLNGTRTFNTGSHTVILVYCYASGTGSAGENATFTNVQLEIGTTATAYATFVPNSPSPGYPSPITSLGESSGINLCVHGKNLHDNVLNMLVQGNISPTTGLNETSVYRCRSSVFYTVSPNTSYIAKANVANYRSRLALFYDISNVFLGFYSTYDGAFMTPANCHYLHLVYESIPGNIILTQSVIDAINNSCQLEIGSTATPYQPFYGNVTTNRSLVLRSLPDGTKDTYNPLTGQVTRRIGVKVFDGTEAFVNDNKALTNTMAFYYLFSMQSLSAIIMGRNTHFPMVTHTTYVYIDTESCEFYGAGTVHAVNIRILKSRLSTADSTGFKAYLAAQYAAGTPITVLYKLATPTTETVDPVTMQTYPKYTRLTASGANITATVRVVDK